MRVLLPRFLILVVVVSPSAAFAFYYSMFLSAVVDDYFRWEYRHVGEITLPFFLNELGGWHIIRGWAISGVIVSILVLAITHLWLARKQIVPVAASNELPSGQPFRLAFGRIVIASAIVTTILGLCLSVWSASVGYYIPPLNAEERARVERLEAEARAKARAAGLGYIGSPISVEGGRGESGLKFWMSQRSFWIRQSKRALRFFVTAFVSVSLAYRWSWSNL